MEDAWVFETLFDLDNWWIYVSWIVVIVAWSIWPRQPSSISWCFKCGYQLRGLPATSKKCPECGASLDKYRSYRQPLSKLSSRFQWAILLLAFVGLSFSVAPGYQWLGTSQTVKLNHIFRLEDDSLVDWYPYTHMSVQNNEYRIVWPPDRDGSTLWHRQKAWTIYIRGGKKSIEVELSPDGFSHTYVDPQQGVVRVADRIKQADIVRWWHVVQGEELNESVELQIAFFSWFIDRWIYEGEYPYPDDEGSYVGFQGNPYYYMRGHVSVESHRIRRYIPGVAGSVGVAILLGVLLCLWIDRRRLVPAKNIKSK